MQRGDLRPMQPSRRTRPLEFRDPVKARALADSLARLTEEIGRAPVSVMHVCGTHEQAIANGDSHSGCTSTSVGSRPVGQDGTR